MRRSQALAATIVALLVVGVLSILLVGRAPSCTPVFGSHIYKTRLVSSNFGAVTTFSLGAPERWPNAIAVAPDGSVWFGEESSPGLAHLFPTNGTFVEYSFPGSYPPNLSQGYTCTVKTDIWGVALWNGRVWATDSAQNRLLGLSPENDTFQVIPLLANDSMPYTLAPGPDGALWFTQIHTGQIGTLFANGTVVEHLISVPEHLNATATVDVPAVPSQIVFANATTGYFVDASPLVTGSPVFTFSLSRFSVERVGGANLNLSDPDSLALGAGGIWLAQHGDSSLAHYDLASGSWTFYPTSRVGYIGTTLPYFVESNGSLIWFNEHFGNRMAMLNTSSSSLTEFSLTSPAAANVSEIVNALTSAVGGGRAWFTESSTDAIGFVDASYKPGFTLLPENSSITVHSGTSVNFSVDLVGRSPNPISTELLAYGSPTVSAANITMTANATGFDSLSGDEKIGVSVEASPSALPGSYTLIVTASDGLISRSVYLTLRVIA